MRPGHQHNPTSRNGLAAVAGALCLLMAGYACAREATKIAVRAKVDPLDRFVRVSYDVPTDAPETIAVSCRFRLAGDADWRVASVRKHRSPTAEAILDDTPGADVRDQERASGEVSEHLAGGWTRQLVWETWPQLSLARHEGARVSVELVGSQQAVIARGEATLDIDLSDVIVPDRGMIYSSAPVRDARSDQPSWVWRDNETIRLDTVEGPAQLGPLALRIGVTGYAAIYVSVPTHLELRLSSDLYNQRFVRCGKREAFWRVAKLDGENIIVSQPHVTLKSLNDANRAQLNYIRIVPISRELYDSVTTPLRQKRDKLVFAYFEPHSWAFMENVIRSSMLAEPVAAYADARVDQIDTQLGRLGSKPVHPSLIDEPLLDETEGDAEPGGGAPTSTTVAQLSALSSAWTGLAHYAEGFDLAISANFGAGIAYPDSTLQSAWAAKNPQYLLDRTWPQYKHPEVRQHMLAKYRELLEQGARRVSVDFCRYPFVFDDATLPTLFLQELRRLCDEFSTRNDRVLVTVRFPVPGNKGENGFFDPQPWIERKLVDFIVPSGVAGNVTFFDARPYIKMTRGTGVKCLPCVEGLLEGPVWPGQVVYRVRQLYDWDADGIYIYQADSRIVGVMSSGHVRDNRALIASLGSSAAVNALTKEIEATSNDCGTDVYLFYPQAYQGCRVRVWIEGGEAQQVQCFIDGREVPAGEDGTYTIGAEGFEANYPAKSIAFEVRAKIRGKWLIRKAEWNVHPSYSF